MSTIAHFKWSRCRTPGCLFRREIGRYCRKHYWDRYPEKKWKRERKQKQPSSKRDYSIRCRKEERERFYSGGWRDAEPIKKDKLGNYYLLRFKGYCFFQLREHRFIMMKNLGRVLERFEIVHHIDGNPLNNELSNLTIINHREADIPKSVTLYIRNNKEKVLHFIQSINEDGKS